jgi:enoyl-CoA hydratase/carnithine racemase
MSPSAQISVERVGRVARLVIDAPPLNLVTTPLLEDFLAAMNALEGDSGVRALLVTGRGARAFSAGARLDGRAERSAAEAEAFRELGRRLVLRIETSPKPVVAAVRGWCVGGGFALAQACDVRLAAEGACFRTGDAYIGVVPSWGVSLSRLVHYIGRNRALDMLMLGEDLSAREAHALGLLTRVLPDEGFDDAAMAVAQRLAGGSPRIFRAIKESVRAQYAEGVAAATAIETRWSDRMRGSADQREGIAALKERRPAVFEAD